jgi:hypothetical protein
MHETDGNDQAFATAALDGMGRSIRKNGLTKREYFAAMAMQGLAANTFLSKAAVEDLLQHRRTIGVPQIAVQVADALIEALNK